jgi:large conductance mechanosensitive channel
MSFASEFKEFAMKGSVIDLAVGLVIGIAFGKIVTSLVDNIIMPVVGVFSGGVDFSRLAVAIGMSPKGEPLLLKYGAFIQSIVDFMIIALVIFVAIKGVNALKKPAAKAVPPPTPRQELLLEEIRALLARTLPANR